MHDRKCGFLAINLPYPTFPPKEKRNLYTVYTCIYVYCMYTQIMCTYIIMMAILEFIFISEAFYIGSHTDTHDIIYR